MTNTNSRWITVEWSFDSYSGILGELYGVCSYSLSIIFEQRKLCLFCEMFMKSMLTIPAHCMLGCQAFCFCCVSEYANLYLWLYSVFFCYNWWQSVNLLLDNHCLFDRSRKLITQIFTVLTGTHMMLIWFLLGIRIFQILIGIDFMYCFPSIAHVVFFPFLSQVCW